MLDVDFYVSLDFLVLDSHENGKIGIIPFPGLISLSHVFEVSDTLP